MQLTEFELGEIKMALDAANKADTAWALIVRRWQHDSSEEAAEIMRKAREEYYQETAKLHVIISKLFRDTANTE